LHQQAENIEAIILGERSQSCDSIYRFHISTNMETISDCQVLYRNIFASRPRRPYFHLTLLRIKSTQPLPRPNRGRALEGAQVRGRRGDGAGDAASDFPGRTDDSPPGWCGGRDGRYAAPVTAAQAAGSRSRLFARQAGAFGGSVVPAEPTVRCCRGPLSGGESCSEPSKSRLKTQPTGISRSKPQTPRAERRETGSCVATNACAPKTHRAQGHGVSKPRRSARPRSISGRRSEVDCGRSRRPMQKIRAAERWLASSCPAKREGDHPQHGGRGL
jgi:hypothetical protein